MNKTICLLKILNLVVIIADLGALKNGQAELNRV